MQRIALLIAAAVMLSLPSGGTAQDSSNKAWDASAIGDQSFAVLAIDIQRLSKVAVPTLVTQRLQRYWNKDRSVILAQVDQFQAIFGGRELGNGADDATHTKLVYLQPTSFDADRVGRMARYKLANKIMMNTQCYVGDRRNHWGGVKLDEQRLVFAVERMTGYDRKAREVWQKALLGRKEQIEAIYLVGGNALIRLGASMMGAFIGIPIKGVRALDEI